MKSKKLPKIGSLAALGLALLVVGCSGSNANCDTDPSQIATAQEDVQSAEQELASAKAQLSEVQSEKQSLEQDLANMPEVDELNARLHALKKGSGR